MGTTRPLSAETVVMRASIHIFIEENLKTINNIHRVSILPVYPYLDWLVGCIGFHGPLRRYFSLDWVVSESEDERRQNIDSREKSKQPSPLPTARTAGPCLIVI